MLWRGCGEAEAAAGRGNAAAVQGWLFMARRHHWMECKVQRAGPGAGGEPEPARAAGMLALHGIFTLVTRHGLEYPRFYERLYQLLTPAAFQARARALPQPQRRC